MSAEIKLRLNMTAVYINIVPWITIKCILADLAFINLTTYTELNMQYIVVSIFTKTVHTYKNHFK